MFSAVFSPRAAFCCAPSLVDAKSSVVFSDVLPNCPVDFDLGTASVYSPSYLHSFSHAQLTYAPESLYWVCSPPFSVSMRLEDMLLSISFSS